MLTDAVHARRRGPAGRLAAGRPVPRPPRPAQLADDQEQDDAAQEDQHRGMQAVGKRQAPHAAAEDIRQHREADHCRAEPGGMPPLVRTIVEKTSEKPPR